MGNELGRAVTEHLHEAWQGILSMGTQLRAVVSKGRYANSGEVLVRTG